MFEYSKIYEPIILNFYQHFNIFGIMTTNLNWIEIQETLFLQQIVGNQPDIVRYFFEIK